MVSRQSTSCRKFLVNHQSTTERLALCVPPRPSLPRIDQVTKSGRIQVRAPLPVSPDPEVLLADIDLTTVCFHTAETIWNCKHPKLVYELDKFKHPQIVKNTANFYTLYHRAALVYCFGTSCPSLRLAHLRASSITTTQYLFIELQRGFYFRCAARVNAEEEVETKGQAGGGGGEEAQPEWAEPERGLLSGSHPLICSAPES